MYDAIIVGARCAGSPTAMLLARQGFKVLLLDRATFPSDTISTHIRWPHGTEILAGTLRAGEVLSGVDGRSMASVRLDRIEAADLTADGRTVSVDRPGWLS